MPFDILIRLATTYSAWNGAAEDVSVLLFTPTSKSHVLSIPAQAWFMPCTEAYSESRSILLVATIASTRWLACF